VIQAFSRTHVRFISYGFTHTFCDLRAHLKTRQNDPTIDIPTLSLSQSLYLARSISLALSRARSLIPFPSLAYFLRHTFFLLFSTSLVVTYVNSAASALGCSMLKRRVVCCSVLQRRVAVCCRVLHVHMYVYIYIHMPLYIYIYIYMYTHTYDIYTQVAQQVQSLQAMGVRQRWARVRRGVEEEVWSSRARQRVRATLQQSSLILRPTAHRES